MACFAPLSAYGQMSYGSVGAFLTNDLNALPAAAAFTNLDGQWVDNGTVSGIYRLLTSDGTAFGVENRFRIDDGGASGGSMYSYGTFGSSDRALGIVTSSNIPTATFGARFRNDTGAVLNQFTFGYTGEQWRIGTTTGQQVLEVDYSLDATGLTTGTFTRLTALDFTAPVPTGTNGALNGNASQNRTTLVTTVQNIAWAPGTDLWVRWVGRDAVAGDHGLAIDDLQLQAVPEPSTVATAAVAAWLWRRNRSRRN